MAIFNRRVRKERRVLEKFHGALSVLCGYFFTCEQRLRTRLNTPRLRTAVVALDANNQNP